MPPSIDSVSFHTISALLLAGSLLFIGFRGPAANAQGPEPLAAVSEADARRILEETGQCRLAVGLRTASGLMESRVICVTEIVKDADTLDEDLGCSVVLYDLQSRAFRAGSSNLRIATNHSCDAQGLRRLVPRPFTEHALRDGVTPIVLRSESREIQTWWEGHLAGARAARRAAPQPTAPPAKGSKKGPWRYDGKSQFEGI